MNGGGSFSSVLTPVNASEGPRHYLRSYSGINARSIGLMRTRPSYDRGNSYPSPNLYNRARPLGMYEAFDCKPSGPQRDATNGEPPCFVQPKSLFDNGFYPRLEQWRGAAAQAARANTTAPPPPGPEAPSCGRR